MTDSKVGKHFNKVNTLLKLSEHIEGVQMYGGCMNIGGHMDTT